VPKFRMTAKVERRIYCDHCVSTEVRYASSEDDFVREMQSIGWTLVDLFGLCPDCARRYMLALSEAAKTRAALTLSGGPDILKGMS